MRNSFWLWHTNRLNSLYSLISTIGIFLVANITSRICGIEDWTGCRKNQGAASWTTECVCRGENCNTASNVAINGLLITLVTLCVTLKAL